MKLVYILLVIFCANSLIAQNFFIENKGQWEPNVKFLHKNNNSAIWLTNDGITVDYFKSNELSDNLYVVDGQVIKMSIKNTLENSSIEPSNELSGYYNYFIGTNREKWASKCKIYSSVKFKNVYKGIDIKYYFEEENIRYDFIVEPNANPSDIKLKFEGQDKISIKNNELFIESKFGEIKHTKLFVYQTVDGKVCEVKSNFVQNKDNTISFNVLNYNKSEPLIIDPLVYSTYIGTSQNDRSFELIMANDGKPVYIGLTWASNYPTSVGAYQRTVKGNSDGVLTKMNAVGNGIDFSTIYGGTQWEEPRGIDIDSEGNIYIAGETISTDFPVSTGCYQSKAGGNSQPDAFVLKFSPDGSQLIYSTYLGTGQADQAKDLEIDNNGFAYVIGEARSSSFPITANAYQKNYNAGTVDGFLTIFSPDGQNVVYSSFIGGTKDDFPRKIIIKGDIVYIAGHTTSTDFPISPLAYQTKIAGTRDAFIMKLQGQGTELLFSTYFGGNLDDSAIGLCFDNNDNIVFTGNTYSTNYPVTNDAYQRTMAGVDDLMITKLSSSGNLLYSTYLGGNSDDRANDIKCDGSGNYYITGKTTSNNFPITLKAIQKQFKSKGEAFVTKFNPAQGGLLYSTYLTGTNEEWGRGIGYYAGDIFVTGYSNSNDFITTANAMQKTFGGGIDIFLTKITPDEGGLDKVVLLYPANKEKDIIARPIFKWNKVDYALTYNIVVAKDKELTNKVFSKTGITALEIKCETDLEADKTYYWAVTAVAGSVISPQSDVYSFTTVFVLNAPLLVSPKDKASKVDLSPTFYWSKQDLVDNYHLRLLKSNNPNDFVFEKLIATDTSYKCPIILEEGKEYFWTVRTIYQGKMSNWSAIYSFTTTSNLKAPVLIYPENQSKHIQSKNTLFYWAKTKFAEEYEINIYSESDINVPIKTAIIKDTFYICPIDLAYGNNITWQVRAKSSSQISSWSEAFTFKTEIVMNKPILISPANSATNIPILTEFKWHKVKYAKNYKLSIEIIDAVLFEKVITDTTFTMSEELEYKQSYYWNIEAIAEDSTSELSETWEFTTKEQIPAPILIIPEEMATIDAQNAKFIWHKVEGANLYNIQVYKRPGSVLVIDEIVGDTVYVPEYPLLYEQGYYYKVSAFIDNEQSPWSENRRFVTNSSSIYDNSLKDIIQIYPIPAKELISLTIKEMVFNCYNIRIYDVSGKICYDNTFITNKVDIPLTNFAKGLYLIEINFNNKYWIAKIEKE